MHQHAYVGQCAVEEKRHTVARSPIRNPKLALFALALGTFAIGTGEFGSNGVIQLLASDLDVSIPVATYAITAYAFGVVIGSPAITLLAAGVNRRALLLGLVVLFLIGNGLPRWHRTSRCSSSAGSSAAVCRVRSSAQGPLSPRTCTGRARAARPSPP
ncbi:hypothetical protein SAMN04488564_11730 [Lentzea waywayandensis]|uniref:Major facilitator superfamily (MFS) profile domain-containing protein n=1 Tax=Lentzea waywayandensis TaxID=84724 RepID=A0A1I6FGN1_9PSEU|nr:hypothetical protein [Lentzea waywayandensis]SFR29106.1 hypothetical protein SAMN04488564_11730 [Lentzea waywayandensis]